MKYAISVTQLVRYLKRKLDRDENIQGVLLKGEISNFVRHRSGHCYFTLKDANAKINCVMFSQYARLVKIPLDNGMQVVARGNVSMFEAGGQVQMYVESIEEEGLGLLYQKLEEAKQKFLAEGLFDASHKKPLVPYPKRIAVISAKEGAATQDVFTTLKRRWPVAEILFFPCLVQGNGAANEIAKTLSYADTFNADVILLVRGGGSIEDLWAFNEEAVIRAVYACKTVVVSGVGHETDTTLVDYVSDHRAPTPTAAAELATPNIIDVRMQVDTFRNRLLASIKMQYEHKYQKWLHLAAHPFLKQPGYLIQQKQQKFDLLVTALYNFPSQAEAKAIQYERLKHRFLSTDIGLDYHRNQLQRLDIELCNRMRQRLQDASQTLLINITKLEANSPLTIMKKGYALTYQNGQIIKSIDDIDLDLTLRIQYPDGLVEAQPLKKEMT